MKTMRPTQLIPGRVYLVDSGFNGESREMIFIERLRPPTYHRTTNVFVCQDYVGLNGPNDRGLTHISDYEIRKLNVRPNIKP